MFEVGDTVEVIGGGYGITKIGSYGKVLGIRDKRIRINFIKIIGNHSCNVIFTISTKDLRLKYIGQTNPNSNIRIL